MTPESPISSYDQDQQQTKQPLDLPQDQAISSHFDPNPYRPPQENWQNSRGAGLALTCATAIGYGALLMFAVFFVLFAVCFALLH